METVFEMTVDGLRRRGATEGEKRTRTRAERYIGRTLNRLLGLAGEFCGDDGRTRGLAECAEAWNE